MVHNYGCQILNICISYWVYFHHFPIPFFSHIVMSGLRFVLITVFGIHGSGLRMLMVNFTEPTNHYASHGDQTLCMKDCFPTACSDNKAKEFL